MSMFGKGGKLLTKNALMKDKAQREATAKADNLGKFLEELEEAAQDHDLTLAELELGFKLILDKHRAKAMKVYMIQSDIKPDEVTE